MSKTYKGDVTGNVVELNLLDANEGTLPNLGTPTVVTRNTGPNNVTQVVGDITSSSGFSSDSSVKGIVIGTSCTSIGIDAFQNCSGFTGSLVIPDSVTSIGDYAFQFCSGCTLLAIGNSVTSIGEAAFVDCSILTAIYVNCPASSWVGTFALGNTNIAPVTMYVNGVTALGYTAGAQTFQSKPLTIVEWTNYPNIP